MTEDGIPGQARFCFDHELDGGGIDWFYWRDGSVHRFEIPAAGGAIQALALFLF